MCLDKELSDFASWLSGSYVSGEPTISFENKADLRFQLIKKVDTDFVPYLISLMYNVQRVVKIHQDWSGGVRHLSEQKTGRCDGFKSPKGYYRGAGVAQVVRLLTTMILRMFETLNAVYQVQIVAALLEYEGYRFQPPNPNKDKLQSLCD